MEATPEPIEIEFILDKVSSEDVAWIKASLPASLYKAMHDQCFDYAMQLRSGPIIRFSGAKFVNRKWVELELDNAGHVHDPMTEALGFNFERKIEVAIDDIIWCCDAPQGS